MRRLLAILLMLILPLQFAWSAVGGLDGHLDDKVSATGFHHHDHDDDHDHHHDAGTNGHDNDAASIAAQEHHDDGHHDEHYHHPVFSMLVHEPRLNLGDALPHSPPVRPPSLFTSHIPALFDWPPSALL